MSDERKLHQMSSDDIKDAIYDWHPDPHPRIRAMPPLERAAYCMLLYKAAGDIIDAGKIPAGMSRWRVAAHLGAAVRMGFFRLESDGMTVSLDLKRRLQ